MAMTFASHADCAHVCERRRPNMPFGQSYLFGKLAGKAAEGFLRLTGESAEESREFGKIYGRTIGGALAVVTFDPAGAKALAADALDHKP